MKPLIITLLSILFISPKINAQITKGSILLGGNFYVGNNKTRNTTVPSFERTITGVNISPSIGYAFKENNIIGVGVSYSHSKSKTLDVTNRETNSYGFDAFYRKYLPLGKRVYFFGQTTAGYTQGKEQVWGVSGITQQYRYYSMGLSLYPGISFAITKKIHIETGLADLIGVNYSHQQIEFPTNPTADQESNTFNFYTNLSAAVNFNLGFRFLLQK